MCVELHTYNKYTLWIGRFAIIGHCCTLIGGGSATAKRTERRRSKESKMKKIGHIRREEGETGEEMVRMGTRDEAVVEIKMLPISTLITIPKLQTSLEKATKRFFTQSQDYSCKFYVIHVYLITCI